MTAIQLQDLTLGYERHPAIHHLTGVFEQGSLTAVVGPNGAGKSTLLKGLMGLLPPLAGQITWHVGVAKFAAYLPQQAELEIDFPITVEEVASLGLWQQIGWFRGINQLLRTKVAESLAKVGLSGFARREVNSLSGGQFQRLLFARLLLQEAQVILLDEPFTAIDQRTTTDLLNLITSLYQQGHTIIVVLHDLTQVKQYFPSTLLLARETIAWGPTTTVLTTANLARAQVIQEAWDEQAPICGRRAS
ncbi:ABC transporter [Achromatium sp. WMS2]|nr:ABC transporter [Achromatium sp. WMS2]